MSLWMKCNTDGTFMWFPSPLDVSISPTVLDVLCRMKGIGLYVESLFLTGQALYSKVINWLASMSISHNYAVLYSNATHDALNSSAQCLSRLQCRLQPCTEVHHGGCRFWSWTLY